tara:strand:+ start:362 stop:1330 length:969 start_codon:yes stop_codon:yes gene_type:complete
MTTRDKYKTIKSKWKALLTENNKVRIRDAANQIGVSEASLLSTEIDEGVSFLDIDNYNNFFAKVLSMNKIMLLIRSDSVVHEKTITTKGIKLEKNKIIDVNGSPILEFNPNLFKYVFAQNKIHANKSLRSFQIFDNYGDAILKIYLKGNDESKFDEIASEYNVDYNYELQGDRIIKRLQPEYIKREAIDFINKLEKKKTYQYDLGENILRKILIAVSDTKIPIQIHAIGLGTIQYHRDSINKIIDFGPWINIIDKRFNLHAIESHLTQTTLNEYNANGDKSYSIDFYDKVNDYVLGICPIKGFNKDFNEIIDTINKPIKEEI